MSKLLAEIHVALLPEDQPVVTRRGDEVVILPALDGEVELLLEPTDVSRWFRALTAAMAREGWCDPPTPP